jgi:hypothetical protein
VTALRDRLIERVNAGVIPGLVAVDENAGAPRLIPDVQGGAAALDDERAPAIESQRRLAVIVELALDDDPALMRDQPSRRCCRPGLPLQREGISMRERRGGAGKPLAVELDRAGGAPNECAVASEDGEGAGLLVGEWR